MLYTRLSIDWKRQNCPWGVFFHFSKNLFVYSF